MGSVTQKYCALANEEHMSYNNINMYRTIFELALIAVINYQIFMKPDISAKTTLANYMSTRFYEIFAAHSIH